jgi:phage terminase small subunit
MNTRESRRHDAFVALYVCDPKRNATRAAIGAGYSAKSAKQTGHFLLKNPKILKQIDRLLRKQEEKVEYSKERWLKELKLIGHSDISDFYEIEEGGAKVFKPFGKSPKDATRTIEVIDETRTITEDDNGRTVTTDRMRLKLWNKLGALEQLGKHFGYLKNDVNVKGSLDVNSRLSIEDFKKALQEASK